MDDAWVRHFDQATQAWYHHNTETGETRPEDNEEYINNNHTSDDAATESAAVDEWRKVYVVSTHGGSPVLKHWALYIVDPKGTNAGFVCNVEGRSENFRYVCKRTPYPDTFVGFVDMYQVEYVDTASLKKLRDFAKSRPVENGDIYWHCQDWVWDVLMGLEEVEILEHTDEFVENRDVLRRLKGPG